MATGDTNSRQQIPQQIRYPGSVDRFEGDGFFWLPGAEDQQRPGRIEFDPTEGGTLRVMQEFAGDPRVLMLNPAIGRIPGIRIHGVTGRHYLTLDGCFKTGTEYTGTGLTQQRYYVRYLITDVIYQDAELSFDEVSTSLDHLPNWVQRSGFKVDLQKRNDDESQDRLLIDYTRPPDQTSQLDGAELCLKSTWSLTGDRVSRAQLEQGTHLAIKYAEPQSLQRILADVKGIQDLVTLATGGPAVPTAVSLWRSDITIGFASGATKPREMSLYTAQLATRVRLAEPRSSGDALFRFSDIGGLDTVARWIDVARRFSPVLGSLLTIRYSAGLYPENRYHNVVSAAETFHRLRFPNEVQPEEEFKAFRRSIIRAIPKPNRAWLGEQLQHSNEPRLRHRLSELVTHTGGAFATIYHNVDEWVTVASEVRNRITHHDESRRLEFQAGDLFILTESIFVLVTICMLRECGVSSTVLSRVRDNSTIEIMSQQLGEIVPRLYAGINEIRRRERGDWE